MNKSSSFSRNGLLAIGNACFLIAALSLSLCHAQDATEEDPFDADAQPAAEAPDKPAAPAAAKPAAAEAEQPVAEQEPAVRAVLESELKTPAQLVRAVDILVQLDNGKLAEPYVKRLQAEKLEPQAMTALVDRFGSATLLRLSLTEQLSPEARRFFASVMSSADAYRRDPKRLVRLVTELNSPNTDVRQEAAIDLALAHEAAVGPLVQVLADPARKPEFALVRAMLLKLAEEAVPPLIGVLETDDQRLKIEVISLLGQLTADKAAPYLVAPLLSPDSSQDLRSAAGQALAAIVGPIPGLREGRVYLEREVKTRVGESRLPASEFAGPTVLWHWDAATRQSRPRRYEPRDAAIAISVRLAQDLHELDPSDAEIRRDYLKLLLHQAKQESGLAKPLPVAKGSPRDIAASYGPDVVENVMVNAMATGFLPAATAAAEILGGIATSELLTRSGAAQSPLVQALSSPDRRLRFAAMDAILRLKPARRFAGSNHITDALGFFAGSVGLRRVVVGHPKGQEGSRIAGLLAELGFEPELATNGRNLFQLATDSPDCELAVVHMSLDRPAVDELLVQLRRDRRTAELPIALVADAESLERAEILASSAGRARAIARPLESRALKLHVDLLTHDPDEDVGPTERLGHAQRALEWLVVLSNQPSSLWDLRRIEPAVLRALDVPTLSVKAALVLANLGTAEGQRAIVNLASQFSRPLAMRQAAAVALRRGIARHRILLTSEEIMEQYDRYNASEAQPAETQAVLASILDTLEGRAGPDEQPKPAPAKAKTKANQPAK